jgi:DNA-directed RNA polymerase specialized sigma subunit
VQATDRRTPAHEAKPADATLDDDALAPDVDPVAANEAALRGLWEHFKETADAATRERLILHYAPLVKYVAARLGIALEDLHQIFSQVSYVNVVALDELLTVGGEKGDKLSLVDTLEDTKAEDPVTAFEAEETKFLLARAIDQLPEREKIVVTLYYYEGLTLAEIGRVLGVTESRICQMHTKAVLQLRAKLAEVS